MQLRYIKGQEQTRQSDWRLVGKLWPHKSKPDAFSGRFGVKTRNASKELIDVFDQIVIKPDDPVMIRKANFTGEKSPSHLIYMLKEEAKK